RVTHRPAAGAFHSVRRVGSGAGYDPNGITGRTRGLSSWKRAVRSPARTGIVAASPAKGVPMSSTPPARHRPSRILTLAAAVMLASGVAVAVDAGVAYAASCSRSYLPLPDPSCQPGAYNPDVTQSTIATTICVSGWTATVRPSSSYTTALKIQQIAEYAYSDTSTADYEEDHLVP